MLTTRSDRFFQAVLDAALYPHMSEIPIQCRPWFEWRQAYFYNQ
jgi:hypothetical protein